MTIEATAPSEKLLSKKPPKITRSHWVFILVGVNAVSMAMMYAMQGITDVREL